MKVVYWDGNPGSLPGLAANEYLVWDCDKNCAQPGYYVLGETLEDPRGPFETEALALAAAESDMTLFTPQMA